MEDGISAFNVSIIKTKNPVNSFSTLHRLATFFLVIRFLLFFIFVNFLVVIKFVIFNHGLKLNLFRRRRLSPTDPWNRLKRRMVTIWRRLKRYSARTAGQFFISLSKIAIYGYVKSSFFKYREGF